MLVNDLTGRIAIEHARSSSIVGMIEANEQCFQIGMASNIVSENFAGDMTIEAFYHSVRLGRIWFCYSARDFEFRARFFEGIDSEA